MKNKTMTSALLIADSYECYHRSVYLYICARINDSREAEDLSQDVFVHLMEYKQILRPDTIKSFIYTITRNLITDYLRRYYHRMEFSSYYMNECTTVSTNETESKVIADDLSVHEKHCIATLPPRRRTIYKMNRYEGKPVSEISDTLHLSHRTVENHLFIGRKEVREYMRQII